MLGRPWPQRVASAGDRIAGHAERIAVLLNGPVTAMIANFVVRVQSPRYLVRMFHRREDAEAWLREALEAPGRS